MFSILIFVFVISALSRPRSEEVEGFPKNEEGYFLVEWVYRAFQNDVEWQTGEKVENKNLKMGDIVWWPNQQSKEWEVKTIEGGQTDRAVESDDCSCIGLVVQGCGSQCECDQVLCWPSQQQCCCSC